MKKVVVSDGKRIELFDIKSMHCVRRKINAKYDPMNTIHSQAQRGKQCALGLPVWWLHLIKEDQILWNREHFFLSAKTILGL